MCSYSTVSDWLGARFFLERPPARKFLPTWSLPCVLEALAKAPFEPLAEASLRDVTIKTGGRATSFSFARGSLFPPLREMSFRSGLWLLSAQLAPRCCRPGLRPRAHDTRSIRRVLGVVYGGFSVEEIRQPIGSRLILLLLFTFGMSPPPSCLFLVQPCWRRHFPVNPIHCPLWGSRSQASRTFSVWV